MFQAFFWMFKNKNFINHIIKLSFISLMFFALIYFINPIINVISPNLSPKISLIIKTLLLMTPILLTQGYFWYLIDEIIGREFDILANNVCNEKVEKYLVINLPKIEVTKLIWRGIASFVASFLINMPYILLVTISKWSGSYEMLPPVFIACVYFGYYLFFPAFFWNYARTNSIMGIIDFRTAIYIMGNYTLNYVLIVILLVIVNGASFYIDQYITGFIVQNNININITTTIAYIVLWFKYLYLLFVNAFL